MARAEGEGERKTVRQRLDDVRDQLGKVSDDTIAELTGVSRGVVGAYRREHEIPAYDGYLWTAGRKTRGANRDGGAEGEPGSEPRPPRVRSRAAEPRRPGRRGSRLDAFRELVGKLSDGEVARRANMTREAVRIYRKKHAIEAFDGPAAQAPAPRARTGSGNWGWRVRAGDLERVVIAPDVSSAVAAAAGLGEITGVERIAEALATGR